MDELAVIEPGIAFEAVHASPVFERDFDEFGVDDRKLIQATLADGSTDTGWVYIMNKLPASAKVIQSGDWKKRREAE